MSYLSPAQQAFLEQHIKDQEDSALLDSLLTMDSAAFAAAVETHDRCLYLPMITMEEAEAQIAANPWIGPDGRLL